MSSLSRVSRSLWSSIESTAQKVTPTALAAVLGATLIFTQGVLPSHAMGVEYGCSSTVAEQPVRAEAKAPSGEKPSDDERAVLAKIQALIDSEKYGQGARALFDHYAPSGRLESDGVKALLEEIGESIYGLGWAIAPEAIKRIAGRDATFATWEQVKCKFKLPE